MNDAPIAKQSKTWGDVLHCLLQVGLEWFRGLPPPSDPDGDIIEEHAGRRSAISFLPGLLASGIDPVQDATMQSTLSIMGLEAACNEWYTVDSMKEGLDISDEEVFHSVTMGPVSITAPQGIPRSHWWWWPNTGGTLPCVNLKRALEELERKNTSAH